MKKFERFDDFYLFYLSEHRNKICRTFHFVGTTLVFITLFFILLTQNWQYLILLPVFGYGFSWIGHFKFERNKPAAFKYPFWSLASDFVMYKHILLGQIDLYLSKMEASPYYQV